MRIASLLPSATEIVCSLGLEDELVAVTHECDFPESVKTKPVLTRSVLSASSGAEVDRHIRELVHQGSSIYALDADLLAALQPDLILTQELCEVCAVSYPIVERAARRLGSSPQLVSLEPQSVEDVFQNILFIGRLVGRPAVAEDVCDALRRRFARVKQRVAGRRARRVVCLEWVDPPFNCGHWTPGLVTIAGGDERLGVAGQPAHPVRWEEVMEADPEVVVVMACGFSLDRSLREVEAAAGNFEALRAQTWVVDGNAFFSRPGPRLVESVEIMAGILHPDAVDPPPLSTARLLVRAGDRAR
ncbi:MAG TPA: ABC transporter substrate-binding protein [Candidatus Dormibacteraeota bacterium]|nr:ABC transporter substrate-binding protein [Candidatus Dormibacteraeota bacterium]